jgi:hypothetical protein
VLLLGSDGWEGRKGNVSNFAVFFNGMAMAMLGFSIVAGYQSDYLRYSAIIVSIGGILQSVTAILDLFAKRRLLGRGA